MIYTYKNFKISISTESPLPSTIISFIRMISIKCFYTYKNFKISFSTESPLPPAITSFIRMISIKYFYTYKNFKISISTESPLPPAITSFIRKISIKCFYKTSYKNTDCPVDTPLIWTLGRSTREGVYCTCRNVSHTNRLTAVRDRHRRVAWSHLFHRNLCSFGELAYENNKE